jgi:hypothetical protein
MSEAQRAAPSFRHHARLSAIRKPTNEMHAITIEISRRLKPIATSAAAR